MKLRDWMYERGISQAKFAERLGITRSYLSALICKLKSPGKKVALAVEKETEGDISASSILTGEAFGYSGRKKRVSEKRRNDCSVKNKLSLL